MGFDLNRGLGDLARASTGDGAATERLGARVDVLSAAIRRRRAARRAGSVALVACVAAAVTLGATQLPRLGAEEPPAAPPTRTDPLPETDGSVASVEEQLWAATCGAPLNASNVPVGWVGPSNTVMTAKLTDAELVTDEVPRVDLSISAEAIGDDVTLEWNRVVGLRDRRIVAVSPGYLADSTIDLSPSRTFEATDSLHLLDCATGEPLPPEAITLYVLAVATLETAEGPQRVRVASELTTVFPPG